MSTATVSLALRNHASISAETRQKVQRIARELGYHPDADVARLMHHLRLKHKPAFQSPIAALTTLPDHAERPYTRSICHGARQIAEALGYGFDIFQLAGLERRNARLQRILTSRGIRGILLLPMQKSISLDDLLAWDSFSCIAATHGVRTPDFHRVVPDQLGNVLTICQELTRLGSRRIGFVNNVPVDLMVEHRFSAAVMWQNTLGGTEFVKPFMYEGNFRPGIRAWFRKEKPDAIIAGTDHEVGRIAAALDLTIPGPVRFAIIDRVPSSSLAGIDQRAEEVGATAMTLLHSKIQTGEQGAPPTPSVVLIKGCWCPETMPAKRRAWSALKS